MVGAAARGARERAGDRARRGDHERAEAGRAGLGPRLDAGRPRRPAGSGSARRGRRRPDGAGLAGLVAARPDVLAWSPTASCCRAEVLSSAPHGGVNLHLSLLPRWRGASPVQHAILAGTTMTGVTVMRMDEGLDTGPILGQLEEPVRPEDDAGLARRPPRDDRRGAPGRGPPRCCRRDGCRPGRRTTARPRGRLKPGADGPDDRLDRAGGSRGAPGPSPRAGTGRGHHVPRRPPEGPSARRIAPATRAAEPGTIVTDGDRGVLVAAGDGSVWVLEVAPAGRARMAAADWARGARFTSGERLGSPDGMSGPATARSVALEAIRRVIDDRAYSNLVAAGDCSPAPAWTRATGRSRPSSRTGRCGASCRSTRRSPPGRAGRSSG